MKCNNFVFLCFLVDSQGLDLTDSIEDFEVLLGELGLSVSQSLTSCIPFVVELLYQLLLNLYVLLQLLLFTNYLCCIFILLLQLLRQFGDLAFFLFDLLRLLLDGSRLLIYLLVHLSDGLPDHFNVLGIL